MSAIEFLTADVVKFDSAQFTGATLLTIIGVAGCFLDALVIYCGMLQRDKKVGEIMILSLCVADLFFSLSVVIFGVLDLSSYGFSSGQVGCAVNAVILVALACISMLSLLFITADRYLIVIQRVYIPLWICYGYLAFIWIGAPIVALVPVFVGNYKYSYALQSGNMNCATTWWDNRPLTVLAISAPVIAVCFITIFMAFAYTSIVRYYLAAKAKKKLKKGAAQKTGTVTTYSREERRLLIKSFSITGAFILAWAPYLLKVFVEIGQKAPVSSGVDIFVNLVCALNPIADAALLLLFDYKIQGEFFELFGIERRIKSKVSEKLITIPSQNPNLPANSPESPNADPAQQDLKEIIVEDQSQEPLKRLKTIPKDNTEKIVVPPMHHSIGQCEPTEKILRFNIVKEVARAPTEIVNPKSGRAPLEQSPHILENQISCESPGVLDPPVLDRWPTDSGTTARRQNSLLVRGISKDATEKSLKMDKSKIASAWSTVNGSVVSPSARSETAGTESKRQTTLRKLENDTTEKNIIVDKDALQQ